MITFRSEKLYGNLGNRFFECASIVSMAQKYGTDYLIPDWHFNEWLETPVNTGPWPTPDRILEEPSYHFNGEFFDQHAELMRSQTVGVGNYLQSEKYFDKELVRSLFRFKSVVIERLRSQYQHALAKPTIAVSVRRGDFVGNPNHYLLPVSYYYLALIKHFPNWRDLNILFFSDDIDYCKIHFECLPNAFFVEGLAPIEQIALSGLCDHFLISNSTFSWWMAWLGERGRSKVIRPNHVFIGKLFEKHGKAPDYFPAPWIPFEHEGKKLDLKDVTFTIPVFYDHSDRMQNINLSVCMLQRDLDTNIVVGEQGSKVFGHFSRWCKYHHFSDMNVFHRTRMLNQMAVMAETPIIVNWDCDVFVPPFQLYLAADAIRNGQDMVYPYDGRFARVPRQEWFKPLEKFFDVGIFGKAEFKGKNGNPLPVSSVGGAVFFNRESFIDGGMENEKMISYAPEDCERYDRFGALGYRVMRVKGCLYHMDHWIGENSSGKLNPHHPKNISELNVVRDLIIKGKDALRRYVDSWEWVDKYTENYYEEITPGSIRSRDAIFEILKEYIDFKTVIDVGCGVGQWGVEIGKFGVKEYRGVDYRIPRRKLMIKPEQYAEHDLRSNESFPFTDKFDLVLCCEVAEHLEEQYAERLVKKLVSLGDTILFSAAIPNQGGKGHVNEQWQDYWAELFQKEGFNPSIVEQIRWNTEVEVWYRQNIVLYRRHAQWGFMNGVCRIQPFVHPDMYLNVIQSLKSA